MIISAGRAAAPAILQLVAALPIAARPGHLSNIGGWGAIQALPNRCGDLEASTSGNNAVVSQSGSRTTACSMRQHPQLDHGRSCALTHLQGQQCQQGRGYQIPLNVKRPRVPYSATSGRPAPAPWPEFERVPQSDPRWHRMVVRFPPEVSAAWDPAYSVLNLSGKAGVIRMDLKALDPTGLVAYRALQLPPSAEPSPASSPAAAAAAAPAQQQQQERMLLALASPDKARFDSLVKELNQSIRGVMSGYLVGITVKGVGYRIEPVEDAAAAEAALRLRGNPHSARHSRLPSTPMDTSAPPPARSWYFEATSAEKQAVTYPHGKPAGAVRLKVGYSRTAVYVLPPHVRAFLLKPTLLYFYGLQLDEVQRVAAEVRGIRTPNPYTGNGIQYVDEVVKLKQRAASK